MIDIGEQLSWAYEFALIGFGFALGVYSSIILIYVKDRLEK